jgi:hypothetical protein
LDFLSSGLLRRAPHWQVFTWKRRVFISAWFGPRSTQATIIRPPDVMATELGPIFAAGRVERVTKKLAGLNPVETMLGLVLGRRQAGDPAHDGRVHDGGAHRVERGGGRWPPCRDRSRCP